MQRSQNPKSPPAARRAGSIRSIGPALIVASVVLGPGSVLTSAKVGCQYGYSMIWILLIACVLMVGLTALSARLGVTLEGTFCDELARRVGRPLAVFVGVSIFFIVANFQIGNNLAVLAAIQPFVDGGQETTAGSVAAQAAGQAPLAPSASWLPALILLAVNASVVAALLGLKQLYRPVEKLMILMVLVMVVGFFANVWFAAPSPAEILGGLIPSPPGEGWSDSLLPVLGMVATTFSVGAAFYQGYLVREKGWTKENLRQGLVDSVVGMSVMGATTLVIMVTGAAVLHGRVSPDELTSTTDVAMALKPLFGQAATNLFSLGIFAAAFSSFMVNAMVGGCLLSDGLGLGGRMDQRWPKWCTVVALSCGMIGALTIDAIRESKVDPIIFAQALTVLAVPVLALSLMYLATRPDMTGEKKVPAWILVLGATGCLVTIALALRTAWRIYSDLTA